MVNSKISIVIPIYQPTFFFRLALESIRRQTYQYFEIIVSDDTHSSEDAKEILSLFTDLDIKYVKNSGERGIFNNLNNAIKSSTGKYIQIFCQDDVMTHDFLKMQLDSLSKYPTAGLVFSKFTEIDSSGAILPLYTYREEAILSWQAFLPKRKAINYLFAFGCIPGNLSPVMLRKEVVEKIGNFSQEYSFCGDYEYWIRVARDFDFAFNNKPALFIRTHDERASNTLGYLKLVPDSTYLYRLLYKNNSIKGKRFRKYLQVNNLVVGYFKGTVKEMLSGKFKYLKLLKYFQRHPFNIPIILMLIMHRFYKRKVSWFIKENEC